MILGTAGHIDHGKTALVRALTGVDTDRLPEEKRRGITIDLGFAPLVIDGIGTIGIVDVPGHEGFVRTMLAGASGIDLALLVVAADEGVMPQTREHLEILSLLEIPQGVVAITKQDLVDDDWLGLVRAEVEDLVRATFLEGAPVIPVSIITGNGIAGLRSSIAAVAAAGRGRAHATDDLFRMPVDRSFSVKGTGTVVTGTIWSGEVRRDSAVTIQPGGRSVRVRGIESHGMPVEHARAGQRAAIALASCDVAEVGRGATLVVHGGWTTSRELEAVLEFTDPGFVPSPRMRLRIHLGTSESTARVSGLRADAADSSQTTARLILDDPILARGGDRFILRLPSPARTIGGGEVIDPYPLPRVRGSKRNAGNEFSGLTDRVSRLARIVNASGIDGVEIDSLPVRTGLSPRRVGEVAASPDFLIAGDRIFSGDTVALLEKGIERTVAIELGNHPLEAGVSLQTIRALMKAPPAVMDFALDRLKKEKRIELAGSLVRPFGFAKNLDKGDQALSDAILHEICVRPSEPPSVSELTAKFGGSVPAMLRRLERDGELERVSDDRYYSVGAVAGMIEAMRHKLDPGKVCSPGELREVLGVTRKYLIPFLEFCDRKGFTERLEKGRIVRPEAGVGEAVSGGAVRSRRS